MEVSEVIPDKLIKKMLVLSHLGSEHKLSFAGSFYLINVKIYS